MLGWGGGRGTSRASTGSCALRVGCGDAFGRLPVSRWRSSGDSDASSAFSFSRWAFSAWSSMAEGLERGRGGAASCSRRQARSCSSSSGLGGDLLMLSVR